MITIEIRHLTSSIISAYLLENDQIFIPPLSQRLNIRSYADKLSTYGVHFCAIYNDLMVGFLGCYINDPLKNTAYISTFSVSRDYQGKGVAKKLLALAITHAKNRGFMQVKLQVHVSNLAASNLYSESEFLKTDRNINYIEMVRKL
jgi:ribosomal protein S18 acetylase RimI-like enzyme